MTPPTPEDIHTDYEDFVKIALHLVDKYNISFQDALKIIELERNETYYQIQAYMFNDYMDELLRLLDYKLPVKENENRDK